jgi:hydrogenase maturation protein HypF
MDAVMPQSSDDSVSRGRRRLLVRGVVQGVGFRPYVFRLAKRYGLAGFVKNTAQGVVIEVEGESAALQLFEMALPLEGPPLMRLESVESGELPVCGGKIFEITASEGGERALAWVPADVAVCSDCLTETEDPENRRYEYPFTNCTNCGPRYSIVLDVPYDRARTTMAGFVMCAACQAEYEDPSDRRFHAQPNACAVCGPHLRLMDVCGKELPVHGTRTILETVVNLLRSGGIVAWKGLGGYQLACDARQDKAVAQLRARKHRNEKPFAVMVRDVAAAETLCEMDGLERALLCGAEKPIVLLRRRSDVALAAGVAPGNPMLGVMLPYTPMHALLLRILEEKCGRGSALVMTSGNMSEEPIVMDEAGAQESLRTVADLFVHHNRPIHTRVDDSVARVVDGKHMLLRRARGYAPTAIALRGGETEVLACGAQQKSTLCLTKGGFAMMSQHLGDLENYETLQLFEQTLERLFQVSPRVVAHDLHPGYMSTQFAKKLNMDRVIEVQHHHAHIASCMAEHGLEGPVLGVAWDGTGFGPDGTIWGGEFFVGDFAGFQRYEHLRNVLLAGGDAAVREPWRVARSYLRDAFGDGFSSHFDNLARGGIGCHELVPEASVRTVDAMLEKRIHTMETSSCGRLFDCVAALLGLHQVVSFEGQAAMALEAIACSADEAYDFTIEGQAPLQVDMRRMVRQIVDDVKRSQPADAISARFHNTLVALIENVCQRMRRDTGLNRVCLGGGCFQNTRLLRGSLDTLRRSGFEVFFPQRIPCNDGGIALGQAAIACDLLRRDV